MTGRAFGWALLAYGIAGVALVVVGAIGGLEMAGRLESLALRADSTLAAAESATRATADSFTGVDQSLEEGEASAAGDRPHGSAPGQRRGGRIEAEDEACAPAEAHRRLRASA